MVDERPQHLTATITRDGVTWVATIPGMTPVRAASLADVTVKIFTVATGGALELVMPFADEVYKITVDLERARKLRAEADAARKQLVETMTRQGVTKADQRRIMSPIPQPRGG